MLDLFSHRHDNKKRDVTVITSLTKRNLNLVILTFSSSFRLLLTLYAWLFIVLSLADLLLDSCLSTVALESA